MLSLQMSSNKLSQTSNEIINFISSNLVDQERAVIGISGGLDFDVVARLTAKAIGIQRMKLFTVIQEGMDPSHLRNAHSLAKELNIDMVEISLVEFPVNFIRAMESADPLERFRPDGLLDPSRAKCSLRTVIFSTYQDRGYVVVGTSNRTEFETGFFLPLGDGLAHIKPILHLYKTQVQQLAKYVGTSDFVLNQPPSAGFWLGEEDLEDMAYWLYNQGPIGEEVEFNESAEAEVSRIKSLLTIEKIDLALLANSLNMNDETVAESSNLPIDLVKRLHNLLHAAKRKKHKKIGVHLPF